MTVIMGQQRDEIIARIAELAQSLSYKAVTEPDREPFQLFGWFRERKFHPDMRVTNGNRTAIIIVKCRFITVYDILATHKARGNKANCALICAPDEMLNKTRPSAWDYAKDMEVNLCSVSDAGRVLQTLLDCPDSAKTTP